MKPSNFTNLYKSWHLKKKQESSDEEMNKTSSSGELSDESSISIDSSPKSKRKRKTSSDLSICTSSSEEEKEKEETDLILKCVDKGIDLGFSAINKVLFKGGKESSNEKSREEEHISESKLVLTPELLAKIRAATWKYGKKNVKAIMMECGLWNSKYWDIMYDKVWYVVKTIGTIKRKKNRVHPEKLKHQVNTTYMSDASMKDKSVDSKGSDMSVGCPIPAKE